MSKKNIDVKGLACPEPVLAFIEAVKDAATDSIEITLDCGAARDNVTRAANSHGWKLDSETGNGDSAILVFSRK